MNFTLFVCILLFAFFAEVTAKESTSERSEFKRSELDRFVENVAVLMNTVETSGQHVFKYMMDPFETSNFVKLTGQKILAVNNKLNHACSGNIVCPNVVQKIFNERISEDRTISEYFGKRQFLGTTPFELSMLSINSVIDKEYDIYSKYKQIINDIVSTAISLFDNFKMEPTFENLNEFIIPQFFSKVLIIIDDNDVASIVTSILEQLEKSDFVDILNLIINHYDKSIDEILE